MTVAVISSSIAPPNVRSILTPVLSALPGAAASTQPATTVLPSLSPILRQRVQLLSSASTEPWIRLLTYDSAQVPQLMSIARSGNMDPHPVSGEIEVDWDRDVDLRYRRLDQETLQTMVILKELSLFFRLVYCTGDPDGGGDEWRVGEVGAADPSTPTIFGGALDISEAEKAFQATKSTSNGRSIVHGSQATNSSASSAQTTANDDDDDDDYWARYDATPSRTPATKRSPAPRSVVQTSRPGTQHNESVEAEDAYFSQYDSVQPAMDNHDPDEEARHIQYAQRVEAPPSLGLEKPLPVQVNGQTIEPGMASDCPALAMPIPIKAGSERPGSRGSEETSRLAHPRPASSASSNGSQTVARLEVVAESRQQTEFGVKQHISRSIRSLFLLSRASGIDRDEFERMVRTELDVLGMVENDI